MASRLSYFLWASIPDDELRRAAAANELTDTAQLQKQVKRMLADSKARRLSSEFFGQWLGFYHFDQSKGVDTTRFPEFTNDVKTAMYEEAVSFFDHIVRQNRPVKEMLSANYTFVNKSLAKFYGFTKEVKSDKVELFEGADAFHRGGVMRLGAVLTATLGAAAHQSREARRLDSSPHRGDSGSSAACRRGLDSGGRQAVRRPLAAREAGVAQTECDLRELPPAHRPAGLLARTLRFHRPLAR